MKNLTVIRYHVFIDNEKIKSFRYLSKAKKFAIANKTNSITNKPISIDKEIIKNRFKYKSSKLIPYFIELI